MILLYLDVEISFCETFDYSYLNIEDLDVKMNARFTRGGSRGYAGLSGRTEAAHYGRRAPGAGEPGG
jgi:hypothetical protein